MTDTSNASPSENGDQAMSDTDTPNQSLMHYNPENVVGIFEAYGITVGMQPTLSSDHTGGYDVCVYPLAHVFPVTALLEETIRYALMRGAGARDRRIGFVMQHDTGEMFVLAIELSDWQSGIMKRIKKILANDISSDDSVQGEEPKTHTLKEITDRLIKDDELRQACRELYQQGRAVILGLKEDQALVEKLKPLFLNAYDLEMPLQFVPAEHEAYRDVHVVQDAITLLKEGVVKREIPTEAYRQAHQAACEKAMQYHEALVGRYRGMLDQFKAQATALEESEVL